MGSDDDSVQMSLTATDDGDMEEADVDEDDNDEDVLRNEHGEPLDQYETVSGANMWNVKSAFQKAVRRDNEMLAAWTAWEMCRSGYGYDFWNRVHVIAFEDIRSESMVPVLLWRFNMQAKHNHSDYSDWGALRCAVRAGLALARAESSHETDHALLAFLRIHSAREDAIENGEEPPEYPAEVPDLALDNHTRDGQMKGRGKAFFMKHSGRLSSRSDIGKVLQRLNIEYDTETDLTDEEIELALEAVEAGDMAIHEVDDER